MPVEEDTIRLNGNTTRYRVHGEQASLPLAKLKRLGNYARHLEEHVRHQRSELDKMNRLFRFQRTHVRELEELAKELYGELMYMSGPNTQGELTARMRRNGLLDEDQGSLF